MVVLSNFNLAYKILIIGCPYSYIIIALASCYDNYQCIQSFDMVQLGPRSKLSLSLTVWTKYEH